jgi:predicted acylesterase/phospholipase RssA
LRIAAVRRALAVVLVAAAATGCGTLPRNPVPADLAPVAAIPGMPGVRAWAGRPDAAMERDLEASFAQESASDFPPGPDGVVTYPHLALSGGGANGAFGAGFLNGWTRHGTRPTFKIVTGVSTGALMAPFAFLGPQYDDALCEFYTTTRTRDVFLAGSALDLLTRLLTADSLADTGPLAALIARHVDKRLLRAVAEAHARGRRLYVGTVDLDAQQFVVWNLGLIASSDHPDALYLFRKAMLASASIPIAFPPVLFAVEAGGARYDELHVDGAVAARVFMNGGVFRPAILRTRAGRGVGRESTFIIHNGQLVARPSPTPRSIPGIAGRVIEATGRSAVIGDLFRIYALSLREQGEFHWTTMPQGVELQGAEVFDPEKMAELYALGYAAAKAGPAWFTRPPGVENRGVPLGDTP